MTKEQLLKVIEDNTICGSDEERILKALTKYCRKERDETAYWKERCEAAERLINVSFSQNNFEEWDNWQRLKNQSPIKPDAAVSNSQDD